MASIRSIQMTEYHNYIYTVPLIHQAVFFKFCSLSEEYIA